MDAPSSGFFSREIKGGSQLREGPAEQQRVREFRAAAIADGWELSATNAARESIDRAWELNRGGFIIRGLTRDEIPGKSLTEFTMSAWGPDRISIRLPRVYDWETILAEVRTCPECNASDVDTVRVGFANRACKSCAPGLRQVIERPGWCE